MEGLGITFYGPNGVSTREEITEEQFESAGIELPTRIPKIEFPGSPIVVPAAPLPANPLVPAPLRLKSIPPSHKTPRPAEYNYQEDKLPPSEFMIEALLNKVYQDQGRSLHQSASAQAESRRLNPPARRPTVLGFETSSAADDLYDCSPPGTPRPGTGPVTPTTRFEPAGNLSFAATQRRKPVKRANKGKVKGKGKGKERAVGDGEALEEITGVELVPYCARSVAPSPGGFTAEEGAAAPSPHSTYGHRIQVTTTTTTTNNHHTTNERQNDSPSFQANGRRTEVEVRARRKDIFFSDSERRTFDLLVNTKPRPLCHHGVLCTDCKDVAYCHWANKIMPTNMPPELRQKILNNNRSIRSIKNELENLLESDVLSDGEYSQIMGLLPQESPLNSSAPAPRNSTSSATSALSNPSVSDRIPPPTYISTGTPSLPPRAPSAGTSSVTTPSPPKEAYPGQSFVPDYPELGRAVALYPYSEPNDCTFGVNDVISIREFTNAEWWYGTNCRTREHGVFPKAYVNLLVNEPMASNTYGYEKGNYNSTPVNNGGFQGQGPPPSQNPYNSAVPPMQIAEQPNETKPGKGQEMGKKFGKKLGNAAIFGAGASLGGNIVNSIF